LFLFCFCVFLGVRGREVFERKEVREGGGGESKKKGSTACCSIFFSLFFVSIALSRCSLKIEKKMDVVFLLKQALAHVVAERSVPPTPLLKELVSKVRFFFSSCLGER
jgi:hypothetical protein